MTERPELYARKGVLLDISGKMYCFPKMLHMRKVNNGIIEKVFVTKRATGRRNGL